MPIARESILLTPMPPFDWRVVVQRMRADGIIPERWRVWDCIPPADQQAIIAAHAASTR